MKSLRDHPPGCDRIAGLAAEAPLKRALGTALVVPLAAIRSLQPGGTGKRRCHFHLVRELIYLDMAYTTDAQSHLQYQQGRPDGSPHIVAGGFGMRSIE